MQNQEVEWRESAREVCASKIPEEPPKEDKQSITARIRMPDGTSLTRRFSRNNTMEDLTNFVGCHELKTPDGDHVDDYDIIQPYSPRDPDLQNLNSTIYESFDGARRLNLVVQEKIDLETKFTEEES